MNLIFKMFPGMTIDEIAAKLGVNRSYISQLRSGKRDVPDSVKYKICKALNIKPSELEK